MNLFSFKIHFGGEEDCRHHFKDQRGKEGICCKKCGGKEHYWLKAKWSYQCKQFSFRTALRSGTVMENSNLPFLVWYKAIFLMSCVKKGFSAHEMQQQLGLPFWSMAHKIREAMGYRDSIYTQQDLVEFDEGYFSVSSKEIERGKGSSGRGAEGKQHEAILAESIPLEDLEAGKKKRPVRYFKAKVLESHSSDEVNGLVRDALDDSYIVFTDKSSSYVDISDLVELHVTEKSGANTTKETIKWVHIAIGNTKRNLLGKYHKIKRKYLQLYLNEFIYKLNRRHFGDKLFERLIIENITCA